MSECAAQGGAMATPPSTRTKRVGDHLLSGRAAFAATIALSLLAAASLTFSRAQAVWETGAFFDSDDAMRAVEIRDYLAGQGWFDLVARRVDPPNGLLMHWSRIVDAPLAGLNILFAHFLSPEYAERATRLVFPFMLLAALFTLVAWLASILSDRTARPAAVWLTLLSGAIFLQFAPGRIDHHAPQIVSLVATLCFFLQGLDPGRASRFAGAAALMALSLAISLENLPFFVVMIAAPPLIFIIDGARAPLLWFSLGALVAFPLLYVAAVPASAYFVSACDAFSAVHLAAALIGVVTLGGVALFSAHLASPLKRLGAVALAGGATLACVAFIAPQCIGDPLAGLDPLLRDLWLSHVAEARPLLSFWRESPGVVIATAAPVALGFIATLVFARASRGGARRRWLLAAATIAVGLAAGLWQTRVFTSVTPLAMAPLAVAVVALVERFGAGVSAPLRALLVGAIAALVSPMGLALAMPPGDPRSSERACLKPSALAPLAELTPARVAAPFDLGAHILAHTPHSVFAAPYHRNNHGNRIAADAFLAPPTEAEAMLRAVGAQIVVWCPDQKPPSALAAASPEGLAALLARGEKPDWLERKALAGTLLLVFALRPAER